MNKNTAVRSSEAGTASAFHKWEDSFRTRMRWRTDRSCTAARRKREIGCVKYAANARRRILFQRAICVCGHSSHEFESRSSLQGRCYRSRSTDGDETVLSGGFTEAGSFRDIIAESLMAHHRRRPESAVEPATWLDNLFHSLKLYESLGASSADNPNAQRTHIPVGERFAASPAAAAEGGVF